MVLLFYKIKRGDHIKKLNKSLLIICSVIIILVISSLTYAYFDQYKAGTEQNININEFNFDLTTSSNTNVENLFPIDETIYNSKIALDDDANVYKITFNVNGNADINGVYKIILDSIIELNPDTSLTGGTANDIKYVLYEGNTKLINGNFTSDFNGVIYNKNFKAGNINDNYILYIYIEDTSISLNKLKNISFNINLNITSNSKVELVNYIKSLSGTVQGSGELVLETIMDGNNKIIDTGYRYEGSNPNNYLEFNCDDNGENCETWRIIGVFDTLLSDGITTNSLVKIVKNEDLIELVWSKQNRNDWHTSGAKEILNTYYYNATNGTDNKNCIINAYNNSKSDCNFTSNGNKKGIKTIKTRNIIENVTWNLGGKGTEEITAQQFYIIERGNTVYPGRPTTDTGKIGLIYPSDYGYGALDSSCSRSIKLNNYSNTNCAKENWLSKSSNISTIMPYSTKSSYIVTINNNNTKGNNAIYSYNLKPTLYLKTDVIYVSGDGSKNNPYKIN